MVADPKKRITELNNDIHKKKGKISALILETGIILIVVILFGAAVGLIVGELAKAVAIAIGSGVLLSVNPIIKINNLSEEINIDEREKITLNNRIRNEKNRQTTEIKKEDTKQEEYKNEKDYISDEDMDRMINLLKKSSYEFKHNQNEVRNTESLSEDEPKKHR